MKNQGALLCMLAVLLWGQSETPVHAAKKYYPPGFTPPSDQKLVPSQAPPAEVAPSIIIQQVPGEKKIIIKTISVEKLKTPKPRDPLLTLLDEHRYYDALRLVNERLKKSPHNLYLQMLRGQILRSDGNFQEAIEQYNDILESNRLKSARANAFNGLGWTHYHKALYSNKRGDRAGFEAELSLADAAFRQATKLLPNLAYAWAGLAKVALTNDQVSEAEPSVKKAKRLAPQNLTVQLAEAELLLAQKKPEEALQLLYGIKKTTTREPHVFLLLAQASLDTGKVDDAIINLKQMLQIVPEDAEGLKLLSQSYELKMKPEDAAQALEKAIALNPSDVDSVEALIKIYDQRNQGERSVLLLKTLLKDNPTQSYFGKLLLQRLLAQGQWEEAYAEGLSILPPTLADSTISMDEQQALVNLFLRATFQRSRGMLNRLDVLKDSATLQALQFVEARLKASVAAGEPASGYDMTNRLNLLFIDPLVTLPSTPEAYIPPDSQLGEALQLAFLQGNHREYDRLLKYSMARVDSILTLAEQLYDVGDYKGAQALLTPIAAGETPVALKARQLQQKAAQEQRVLQEHLASFSMLPGRISSGYWQKAAIETLRVGNAHCEVHGLVAKGLERRDQASLALLHQRLAAQYATTPKDEKYWRRQAEKNAKRLGVSLANKSAVTP